MTEVEKVAIGLCLGGRIHAEMGKGLESRNRDNGVIGFLGLVIAPVLDPHLDARHGLLANPGGLRRTECEPDNPFDSPMRDKALHESAPAATDFKNAQCSGRTGRRDMM